MSHRIVSPDSASSSISHHAPASSTGPTETASVWGPTCDSIDCVRDQVELPVGLEVGDWLGWANMGAYTLCAASTFNGFNRSPVHWTIGGQGHNALAVRKLLASG